MVYSDCRYIYMLMLQDRCMFRKGQIMYADSNDVWWPIVSSEYFITALGGPKCVLT
jgi:hypothetical protein